MFSSLGGSSKPEGGPLFAGAPKVGKPDQKEEPKPSGGGLFAQKPDKKEESKASLFAVGGQGGAGTGSDQAVLGQKRQLTTEGVTEPVAAPLGAPKPASEAKTLVDQAQKEAPRADKVENVDKYAEEAKKHNQKWHEEFSKSSLRQVN